MAGGTLEKGESLSHKTRVRRLPPVCLLVAGVLALVGRLRLRHLFMDRVILMEDGRRFRVFRHLSLRTSNDRTPAVLVVRFEFSGPRILPHLT